MTSGGGFEILESMFGMINILLTTSRFLASFKFFSLLTTFPENVSIVFLKLESQALITSVVLHYSKGKVPNNTAE